MLSAPVPPDDAERIAELRAYAILDTPGDDAFDDLTALAADVFETPIALVSLVDRDRQWFKSRVGLDASETPRDVAFCGHAICQDGVFVVEDALADERFAGNPFVIDAPHIRFYAGAVLKSSSGYSLGTLCVIDSRPRRFDEAMRQRLEALGRQASRQLEFHRQAVEAQLRSYRDELTGLANRAGLLAFLERARGQLTGERVSRGEMLLAYVDLDRFKPINDTLGHEAGDAVLRAIGKRLGKEITELQDSEEIEAGVAARLGGDEFALAVWTLSAVDSPAAELPERIRCAVSAPVHWRGQPLSVDATVGLATSGGQDAPETLLRNADLAMYHAKRNGGGGSAFFEPAMLTRVYEDLRVEAWLRRAVTAEGGVSVWLQPVVDLRSGDCVGFEVAPGVPGGVVGPLPIRSLLAAAERAGVAQGLFDQVATGAFRVFASLQEAAGSSLWLSINLAGVQLSDRCLDIHLLDLVRRAGLTPGHLRLEITEAMVSAFPDGVERLRALCDAGFALVLGGFGVGLSSLSCLHRLPLSALKIDRSFTAELARRRDLAAVIDSVALLSRNLGFQLIAEGADTAEQVPMLQSMEIGAGQGLLFGQPMDPREADPWLRQRRASAA